VGKIPRAALFVLMALVLLYAGDYISARFRLPNGRQTLGSVDVQVMWAIKQKDGRIDYELGDTETQPCLHSLFPHLGYTPCWYLVRHKNQVIKVGRASPPGVPLRYPVNSCRVPPGLLEPTPCSSSSSRCVPSAI
jgi:hypothetical protein